MPQPLPDLSPYEPIRPLGEGGAGRVILASDPVSRRLVTVKIVHAELVQGAAAFDRLVAHAAELRAIRSSRVAPPIEVRRLPSGEACVVSEYVEGRDLGDVLAAEGALDASRVIRLALDVARALAAAHAAGIVHGDVKPHNVLVERNGDGLDRARLLDFASAEITPGAPAGAGAAEYWSPERAAGRTLDARSDVYALGIVLYEALSGRLPFTSHSLSDIVSAHLRRRPEALRQPSHTEPIPAALSAIVLRCLEKDPAARGSAAALVEALAPLASEPGALPPEDSLESTRTSEPHVPPAARMRRASLLEAGTVVGSYRILGPLGDGSMGVVYLAVHMALGRRVALKMLRPELAGDETLVTRFFAEARAVNQIAHDNIIEVTDFVQGDGASYYIMELLRGTSIQALLARERRLTPGRAVEIAVQMCDALAAVHDAGIVHRDLKPENVFLIERAGRRDFVKILDFGVARILEHESGGVRRTVAGGLLGTPQYMSPEAAGGRDVDHRTDVYSLGVMLYEMVTGRCPFEARTIGEVLVKHLSLLPTPPSELLDLPEPIPAALERTILWCLDKSPASRPQNMRALGAALRDVAGADRPTLDTIRPASVEAGVVVARPRRWAVLASAGGLLAVAAMALTLTLAGGPSEVPTALRGAHAGGDEPAGARGRAASGHVEVAFESTPPGAEVLRDGDNRPLGTTPFSARLPRGTAPVTFTFRLAGYELLNRELIPDADAHLATALTATAPAAPPAAAGAASAKLRSRAAKKTSGSAARARGAESTVATAAPAKGPAKIRGEEKSGTIDPFH